MSLPYTEQHYFSSYDHFGIHEEMLKDESRTLSYKHAILRNRDLFKDKIVLDVGCGTGILSMFAAQAGAKHVMGVDMSNIIEMARKIVDLNGLSDKITLIQGKMEEITLPYQKVDIIISEWMGYFLLYESMLDTVLYARDKYLVPGGIIMPDKSTIYAALLEDGEYKDEKVSFWDDVYGFDYSPFKDIVLSEPLVDTVDLRHVISNPCQVFEIDLYTVKVEDLAFKANFDLKARVNDTAHAILCWFDIEFNKLTTPVKFSTGPHAKYTHWKQTVFYIDGQVTLRAGDEVTGSIDCRPNGKNNRDLDITLEWECKAENKEGKRFYCMK